MAGQLPEEIKAVMDNGVPVLLATCSKAGIPNTTIISQVYYVDANTVALSFQFFNKTTRNVRENHRAAICLNDLHSSEKWLLQVEFDHAETEGPIFEQMDMHIEAIASATGMSGIFKLKAADIYKVLSVKRVSLD